MTGRVPVGIVGANGFLGGELVRLLAGHPHVELAALCAGSSAGKTLSAVRPSLRGPAVLESFDAEALAERCAWVFLALPHGESARAADALLDQGVGVIDLGSDFRLVDPADHRRYYGREPGAPHRLAEAVYSLPELTGPPPAGTRLVANPGCFATALALSIAPLAPLVASDARITVFGVTGSSGSGVNPSAGVHHSLRMTSFVAYKTLRHQHLGELRQLLGARGPVPAIDFVPHSAPVARGIHLTLTVPREALSGDPLEALRDAYAGKPLVEVVEGEVPMGSVVGSARALIGVTGDERTAVVFAAIDNLIKGGSGQAVQNLNLLCGWDETTSLPIHGMWP